MLRLKLPNNFRELTPNFHLRIVVANGDYAINTERPLSTAACAMFKSSMSMFISSSRMQICIDDLIKKNLS
ncbi:hypothetical protein NGI46_25685 [Peribacillus butanolivorans]|nr:hypothetical protein [Peribacillus butanolivorans]